MAKHFSSFAATLRKNCFGYFLGDYWKFGLLLFPASGHTGSNQQPIRQLLLNHYQAPNILSQPCTHNSNVLQRGVLTLDHRSENWGCCYYTQRPWSNIYLPIIFFPRVVSWVFKNGPISASFFIFRPFLIPISNTVPISAIQIEKRVVGVLGIRTGGHRMVGADELWQLPTK